MPSTMPNTLRTQQHLVPDQEPALAPAQPQLGNLLLQALNGYITTITTKALRGGCAIGAIGLAGIALSPSTIRPYTAPLLMPFVTAGAIASVTALLVKKYLQ